MRHPDSILKPLLGLLHNEKQAILRAWQSAPAVEAMLGAWRMPSSEFEGYGAGILEHLLSVMAGQRSPGDCPTLRALLERLAGSNVSVGDIFCLCIHLRHSLSDVVYKARFEKESASRYRQFLDALHRFFDANLKGVLDRYYDTLLQKDQELARLGAENESKDQLLQLQARQATMGEMIGAIAHQWKQPLNALSLQAQDLEACYDEGSLDGPTLKAAVVTMMEQVAYMSRTIDDFRRFFQPAQESRFEISAAIEDAMSLVGRQYHNRGIDIRLNVSDDAALSGRRNDFVQVLLVLFSNAKDAVAAKAGRRGLIELFLGKTQGGVRLCVQDNGGGIDEAVLPRLFEPYVTGKQEGTGIGLYIARRIVEKMGGRIEAVNKKEGACFCMEFPCQTKGEGD
ncbi:MAG: sensor histidine kinase [Campylobacterales bacterium]